VQGQSSVDYLEAFVRRVTVGWQVAFSSDSDLSHPSEVVRVDAPRLVVGLANGWAGDGKFLLIYPEQVGAAYARLSAAGLAPRGFAFWDIFDEGRVSVGRPEGPAVWMASGLNAFMGVRKGGQDEEKK
jgi:hypothetical protein